jgi:hypothetical protein
VVAHQDQDKKGGTSPLYTPKGLRDAKKDFATKTANGSYSFVSAYGKPKNQEKEAA